MSGKPTIPRTCEWCGADFLAFAGNVRRGFGRFCSRDCYAEDQKTRTRPVVDRFWEKVDRDGPLPEFYPELGPCWIWMAGRNEKGYGVFKASPSDANMVLAHRFAYELANGPMPDGLFGLHYCDRPACVNPLHIWPGTHRENMDDMVSKGRYSTHPNVLRGEESPDAKLTEQNVRTIRRRYAVGDVSQHTLAAEYGVSQGLIRGIIRRTAWPHIDDPDAPAPLPRRRVYERGEQIGTSTLTATDVIAIRHRYGTGHVLQKTLAAEYGTTVTNISMIVSRRTWRHLA